jgi:hypothetical protein
MSPLRQEASKNFFGTGGFGKVLQQPQTKPQRDAGSPITLTLMF